MSDTDMTIQEQIARAIEAELSGLDTRPLRAVDSRALMRQAYREAARIARETDGWVAVGDGLPRPCQLVMVAWDAGALHPIGVAVYDAFRWWSDLGVSPDNTVIAWQYLPEPPLPRGGDR